LHDSAALLYKFKIRKSSPARKTAYSSPNVPQVTVSRVICVEVALVVSISSAFIGPAAGPHFASISKNVSLSRIPLLSTVTIESPCVVRCVDTVRREFA
jgi:hypothetical protein